MSSKSHIVLRPSPTYLFSYVWLALELVLFTFIIEWCFTASAPLITTLFMLCFARIYYWLNFSPESVLQTLFIFGVIPLVWMVDTFGSLDELIIVVTAYAFLLVFFGLFRIVRIKYQITSSIVTLRLIRTKSFEIDNSRSVEMYQHKRGEKLNFGCIIIPIIDPMNSNDNFILSLLFQQRSKNRYAKSLRIDGIRNPQRALQDVRKQLNEKN